MSEAMLPLRRSLLACAALTLLCAPAFASGPLKVLIIDGQNNHAWRETTPVLKQILEASGRFKVDVVTAPAKGGDMSGFKPNFGEYKAVLSNYNGEAWSPETQTAFEAYVRKGGGFVSF